MEKRDAEEKEKYSGLDYVGRTVKAKAAIHFDPRVDCCKVTGRCPTTECRHRAIPEDQRKEMSEDFWALGSYNSQNGHLYGLIDRLPKIRLRNRQKSRDLSHSPTTCLTTLVNDNADGFARLLSFVCSASVMTGYGQYAASLSQILPMLTMR